MNEFESYVYGLLVTDGNLSLSSRNRGKISLEISIKDKDIAQKLFENIPNSSLKERTRNTNFKEGYNSIIWSNHQIEFRNKLIEYGFPIEDKTNQASIPKVEYIKKDFWRGVIDGDGSIGFTTEKIPFISLTTKSEDLKNQFLLMLRQNFNIVKNINRNKRDNVYNITLKNEDALKLADYLYKDNKISINRKNENYIAIMGWTRVLNKTNRRSWTIEEDKYILNNSVEDSINFLKRTKSSILNRKFRLKSK